LHRLSKTVEENSIICIFIFWKRCKFKHKINFRMTESVHSNNVYAYNDTKDVIHVSEAESGRNGYFCLGCRCALIAKKGKVLIHHFAHDAKDVKRNGTCTFSDESYRHKLAKEILQRLGFIKVPALYKYCSENFELPPNKIKATEKIFAHRVDIELPIYEDEAGTIKWDRGFKSDSSNHLFIQPDVVFFDEKGEPKLLIELVATHKIDRVKLEKIRNLRIDTIQVIIPRDSPESIEGAFSKTVHTKWVYNNEIEQAEYVRNSEGNGLQIPLLDKVDAAILKYEESYECRKAEINNFIRTLTKVVGSSLHREAKEYFRVEIQRVEENSERAELELERLQDRIRTETAAKFESEESDIESREGEFQKYFSDLENRYLAKREYHRSREAEVETEEREFEPDCQPEIDRVEQELETRGSGTLTLSDRITSLREEEEELERSLDDEEAELRYRIELTSSRVKSTPDETRELEEELTRNEEDFKREDREKGERLDREFETNRRATIDGIKERDCKFNPELNQRIRDILSTRGDWAIYDETRHSIELLQKAKGAYDDKCYKNWLHIR
jgi:hypothetical protein